MHVIIINNKMNILEIEEAIIELKDLSLGGSPSKFNLRKCLTKNST